MVPGPTSHFRVLKGDQRKQAQEKTPVERMKMTGKVNQGPSRTNTVQHGNGNPHMAISKMDVYRIGP